MADVPSVYRISQLSPESTLGVVVPASKRLLCTYINPSPVTPTTPYRPQGQIAPVTAVQRKENTTASVEGAQCYSDLPYMFASYLKTEAITTPSGATNTRRYTYKPSQTAADTFRTYTIETGFTAGGAERYPGAVFDSLTLRYTDTDCNVSGNVMAQVMSEGITMTGGPTDLAALPIDPKTVSVYAGSSFNTNQTQTVTISSAGGAAGGGTFTLSFEGQTTGNIAFNAIAATIQTALNTLSTIGANGVTVGGGPAPGAFTATFGDKLAGCNATLLTGSGALLTGAGSPYTIAVANTTPGGMTKLTRVASVEVQLPARYVYPFTVNDADPSYSYIVQQGIEPRVTLALEHDSASVAFMTTLRARTLNYLKIVCRAIQTVEVVSSIPYVNALQLAMPFRWINSPRSDANGIRVATWELAAMYDTTFAGFIQADVDCGLAAL